MKKFNLKRMIAYVLVAMLTLGVFSVNASAEQIDTSDVAEAVALAELKGYELDAEVKAELEAIVKEAADSLDIVEEGADPAKSTFVTFKEYPVKVVKYDGEGHGLKAVALKTVGLKKVADTTNLYVGITADGTIYRSFEEPVEVGYYYAVCMYPGDANNYPSVAYGIIVILPACEPCPPVDPETPTEASTEERTEAPTEESTEASTEEPTEASTEEPTEASTEEPTEAPTEEPTEASTEEPTEAPTEEPTEAPATDATTSEEESPKTGDETNVMLYAVVTVVALGGMAAIVLKKRNA